MAWAQPSVSSRGADASAPSGRSRISVYANDTRRLRTWLLAIGVAVIGVHLLEAFGELDLTKSIYTGSRLELGALIIGGLIFGIGMALNGTCGMGTLRQIGGGDLRAVITFLVMGVTAMMTMRGLTGVARVAITDPLAVDLGASATQRLPLLAGLSGQGATIAAVVDRTWRSRSLHSRIAVSERRRASPSPVF